MIDLAALTDPIAYIRWGGGSQILGWMYARGGGGLFRCVLCATGGVGGSKNRVKMRI